MEYSIYSGDSESGISYMQMNEGLDEGPIFEIHKCKIEKEDDLGSLESKFVELSKKSLLNYQVFISLKVVKTMREINKNRPIRKKPS